jgi:hypothetical protein
MPASQPEQQRRGTGTLNHQETFPFPTTLSIRTVRETGATSYRRKCLRVNRLSQVRSDWGSAFCRPENTLDRWVDEAIPAPARPIPLGPPHAADFWGDIAGVGKRVPSCSNRADSDIVRGKIVGGNVPVTKSG